MPKQFSEGTSPLQDSHLAEVSGAVADVVGAVFAGEARGTGARVVGDLVVTRGASRARIKLRAELDTMCAKLACRQRQIGSGTLTLGHKRHKGLSENNFAMRAMSFKRKALRVFQTTYSNREI